MEARAMALSEASMLISDLSRSAQMKEAVDGASHELSGLNAWQKANVREAKRFLRNQFAVDPELLEKKSMQDVLCEHAWRKCRAQNDWQNFVPELKKLMVLVKEEARQRAAATNQKPYDALLDMYEPGVTMKKLDEVFHPLKSFLLEFIPAVLDKQKQKSVYDFKGSYPIENQKNLGLELMKVLGFDFNLGRLDVSLHPFCGGVPQDVRITTRYSTEDFTQSLMGVIHETGHALYEQNLPKDYLSQPVGSARGMAAHESQSLHMEMQLGRSREFMAYIDPMLRKHLPSLSSHPHYSIETMYDYFTEVKPDFIRVDADEATYPMHIILRYEIERDLIEGDAKVEDIPGLWDQKMKDYLSVDTKGNFKNGCLQDIHWPSGSFGYFPSYTLGAMMAAQLRASMGKALPNVSSMLRQGDLSQIKTWLKDKVWSQASFHENVDELCKHATGEALNSQYFIQHLKARYL